MKKGFTLLEVLLAVAVMATGVLSVVILYSLGFRETRQSREDVASASYADAVMSPLVNAISATNLAWSSFKSEWNYPSANGWSDYYDSEGRMRSNPESIAMSAFSGAMGKFAGSDAPKTYPSTAKGGLVAGLVVLHEENSAIVRIGFRAARNAAMLMSAPLYYTEARFQGDPNK